jgi:Lon protease-like protein
MRIGVMTLGGCTLFPQAVTPLYIFEPRYRAMLADSLEGNRLFCLAMQDPASSREKPRQVAGLGVIRASYTNDDGTSNVLIQGLVRVRLGRRVQTKPYRMHEFEPLIPDAKESLHIDALCSRAMDLVEARLRTAMDGFLEKVTTPTSAPNPEGTEKCLEMLRAIDDAAQLADFAAASFIKDPEARQGMLETVDIEERLRRLVKHLTDEANDGGLPA